MGSVQRSEVIGLGDYEAIRPHFRARVIEEKKRRRVLVGPTASLVFENHDTVLLQIQEMLRTERITREDAVQHEIDTYNALVPRARELSATLMFEIVEKDDRDAFLVRAAGVQEKMSLVVGGERCPVVWEKDREFEGRTTAVHYLKIPLTEKAAKGLRDAARGENVEVAFDVDHDAYRHRAVLSRDVIASLVLDLEGA
jgi:hypothetical protein